MNLHEYQAKEVLKRFNVPVQEGIVCSSPLQAEDAYRQIHSQFGSKFAVVKAQIHAGGRGKGKIAGTDQRGVAVGKNAEEVKFANWDPFINLRWVKMLNVLTAQPTIVFLIHVWVLNRC